MLTFCKLLATVQKPDVLLYDGVHYMLDDFFLEEYFEMCPEMKPEVEGVGSNLWRGYYAEFEMIYNKIYLKDLFVPKYKNKGYGVYVKWESVFKRVFPNRDKLLLDWLHNININLKCNSFNEDKKYCEFTHDSYLMLSVKFGEICLSNIVNDKICNKLFNKDCYLIEDEDLSLYF